MSDVIFPTQIPDGTPASNDKFLFSDASDSNLTKDGLISDFPVSDPVQAALDLKEDSANKGQANGYAPLDATGKVPAANLPTASGTGDVIGPASATDNAIARFDGTTGKLVQSSPVTVSDGGDVSNVNGMTLDVTPTAPSSAVGTLRWNSDEDTLDVIQTSSILQVGQELQWNVRNATGVTIPNGTAVYANGTIGASGRITIAPYIADGSIPTKYYLGITTEDILTGEDGKVTAFGKIRDLDTSAYPEGTVLYVSPTTAGALTATEPATPNFVIPTAFVITSHASVGTIAVRVPTIHSATECNYDNSVSLLSATNVQDALDELAAEKIQEPTNAYATGYVLTWNGSAWVGAEVAPSVGTASKFYLDATATIADNLALSATPSTFPETTSSVSADSDVGGGIGFLERFVSAPLGLTEIPAGDWNFSTYANPSSVTGDNFVEIRLNKRVAKTGMTATFTGTGPTRTLTVTGGAPFVAGDVGDGTVLSATLIETPLQTAWISGFTSSSVVTVTLTDPGYVNESDVNLNALYYRLFLCTSGDLTATGSQLVTCASTQPAFTIGETDRIVAAYFFRTTSNVARTCDLYYGGSMRFSSLTTPLSQATPASSLKTDSGEVYIGTATAPTAGQVLTATSPTTANWQTPTPGSSGGPSPILEYSTTGVPVAGVTKTVRLSQGVTFSKLAISLATLPVGGNFEVNVKKNGTTILSGNLTITTSESASNGYYTVKVGDAGKSTITTLTAVAEDVISCEIIAGSGNTFLGADCYVVLTGTLA